MRPMQKISAILWSTTLTLAAGAAAGAAATPVPPTESGAAWIRTAESGLALAQPDRTGRGRMLGRAAEFDLTVQGEGHVFAPADRISMVLSTVTQAESASEAMQQNAAVVEEVMAALRDLELDEDEYETGRYMISPVYEQRTMRDVQESRPPQIVAYRVTNGIRVETQRLEMVGKIIERSIEAGANQVDSLQFELANPERARAEAIRKATQNAQREARILAEAAGVQLGVPITITLEPGGINRPYPIMGRMMEMDAGGGPQIMPGDIEVTAAVTIVYHFNPRSDDQPADDTGSDQ